METIKRCLPLALFLLSVLPVGAQENLISDPSFELPKEKDQWGHVFEEWSGWIYEGECEFRVSRIARTGDRSLLIVGGTTPKIRACPDQLLLKPGRYRVTAYIRGLDIGAGFWNQTTEFMFAGKYIPLEKNGTFGWTQLTYVGDVEEAGDFAHPSFGLMAPGYLWIDDVSVERVADDTPLTPQPILGLEEEAIVSPETLGENTVRCPECGYRNMPTEESCYACGSPLENVASELIVEPIRVIASFEQENPFDGGTVVERGIAESSEPGKALRIDQGYASMDAAQDWTGYDCRLSRRPTSGG